MSINDYTKLCDIAKELQEYADYEGSELGEYWSRLIELKDRATDIASPEFMAAYIKEMEENLAYAKESFEIEEVVESTTTRYKQLKYIGE